MQSALLTLFLILIVVVQTRKWIFGSRNNQPSDDYSDVGVVLLCVSLLNIKPPCLPQQKQVLRSWLNRRYDNEHVERRMALFDRLQGQQVNVNEALRRVMYYVPIDKRYLISDLLFSLSAAKGYVSSDEFVFIRVISEKLYVDYEVFNQMSSRYYRPFQQSGQRKSYEHKFVFNEGKNVESQSAYTTLGCKYTDNEDTIKSSYRKLVMKYHPDKWVNASESEQKKARESFLKIKESYEKIKKMRGFA